MSKDLTVVDKNPVVQMFREPTAMDVLVGKLNSSGAEKFLSAVRICLSATPDLIKCTKKSLFNAFMQCVELNLYPSNTTGECYVIPYKIKGEYTATFQLGYQGMVTLAYRAGTKKIDTQIVFEKDNFVPKLGLHPDIIHTPDLLAKDRGEPVAGYVVAILESGESVFRVMNKHEILAFRELSQSWKSDKKYKTKNSPWNPEGDPQLNMWRKTLIRQIYKVLPKSPIMQQAIIADTRGDVEHIKMDSRPDTMTSTEIAEFVQGLSDSGYSQEDIEKGIQKALNRDTLEPLTRDESIHMEDTLKANNVIEPGQAELIK